MLTRIGALIALLAFAVLACGGGQPAATPEPGREAPPVATEEGPAVAASEPEGSQAPPGLVREIPPCTLIEGASVDPCNGSGPLATAEGGSSIFPSEPRSVRSLLDGGRGLLTTKHLVVRGTYMPNTVRCLADDTESFASYVGFEDTSLPGGVTEIRCFADVRVNAYLLGSGPSTLTVMVETFDTWLSKPSSNYISESWLRAYEVDTFALMVEEWRALLEDALLEGWDGHSGFPFSPNIAVRDGGIDGVEQVIWLYPSYDVSVEAWATDLHRNWSVERKDDGTVVAVHPHRHIYAQLVTAEEYAALLPKLEMSLAALTTAITTADTARRTENGGRIGADADLPDLVDAADELDDYLTDVGAYSDDRPRTPIDPPPACGLVVSNQTDNQGLMADCLALLAGKDTLRGTATLNWDTGTAIASWDGITTSGTPTRVTKLELPSESLTGSLPADLGRVVGLTHLDLSGNTLTGEIPFELIYLKDLKVLKLTGNSFTGCLPLILKDNIPTNNDLASLNLLYCRPPAPENVSTGAATETGIPLSWDAVSNASKYRVEYREGDSGDWTLASDTVTGTTHTVEGLQCGREHQFRVGAYGSGTLYATAWSEPSAPLKASTAACTPPVFGSASYSFSVMGDAAVGAAVGTVSAADAEGDTVTYAIAAGNGDGKFAIGESTGAITVAGDLTTAVGASFTLTVQATGESGDAATVPVTIAVTKACSGGTAAPNPATNPGLVSDCKTLLGLKSTLAGDAALNWSADQAMTAWDGVAVRGSPSRVARLNLQRKGLTGSVPPELGELAGLSTLDLSM